MGRYERLNEQPVARQSTLPFFCLTDDPELTSDTWTVVPIEPALPGDPVRSARMVKILGHPSLSDFDQSLYIDNSVVLTSAPEAVFDRYLADSPLALPTHSFRKTLAAEFEKVEEHQLDDSTRIAEQLAHLSATHAELLNERPFWTGILLRDHRDAVVRTAMNYWASDVLRYARRDQLSANKAFARAALSPNRMEIDNYESWFHVWPRLAQRNHKMRVKRDDPLRSLQQQITRLEQSLAAERETIDELRTRITRQKETIDGVMASTSWRITAPLRATRQMSARVSDWYRNSKQNDIAYAIGLKPLAHLITDALTSRARSWKRRGLGRSRVGRMLIDLCLYPDDFRTINRSYVHVFGTKPRLFRPRTFNEKIQAAKLFARSSKRTMLADKLLAREFVKDRLGDRVALPKIHWIGSDLIAAREVALPPRFVIKANHGSGYNIVVGDSAELDWIAAAQRTSEWLRQDFCDLFAEWQYRWIQPRLFIEEFLEGPSGDVAFDYRFSCFAGRVEFVGVRADVRTQVKRSFFTRDFEPLPVGVVPVADPYRGPPPRNLSQMIELAEAIAAGERFVRIDLYEGDPPIFSEVTWSPGGGHEKFDPPEWDAKFGALWP